MTNKTILEEVLKDRAQFWTYGDKEAMFEDDIKVRIKLAIQKATEKVLSELEHWYNSYLDEFQGESSFAPMRKGKCCCMSCSLSREIERIKQKFVKGGKND